MIKEILKEFEDLVTEIEKLIDNKQISWELKYNLIFNKRITDKLNEWKMYPNYYDPDSSYEEDVLCFYVALKDQLNNTIMYGEKE